MMQATASHFERDCEPFKYFVALLVAASISNSPRGIQGVACEQLLSSSLDLELNFCSTVHEQLGFCPP